MGACSSGSRGLSFPARWTQRWAELRTFGRTSSPSSCTGPETIDVLLPDTCAFGSRPEGAAPLSCVCIAVDLAVGCASPPGRSPAMRRPSISSPRSRFPRKADALHLVVRDNADLARGTCPARQVLQSTVREFGFPFGPEERFVIHWGCGIFFRVGWDVFFCHQLRFEDR